MTQQERYHHVARRMTVSYAAVAVLIFILLELWPSKNFSIVLN